MSRRDWTGLARRFLQQIARGRRGTTLGAAAAIAVAILAALQSGVVGFGGDDRGGARAERPASAAPGERPFDYYVLALSWSPTHCLDEPEDDQCDARRRFITHGLWPQFETGWPSDCATEHGRPSNSLLRRYADLTESPGLLAYQWRKHGSCSGLPPAEYFAQMQAATDAIAIPPALDALSRDLDVDPRVVETAFLEANGDLTRDGVVIRCASGRLQEVRICLTADLTPRACGAEIARDCSQRPIDVPAPR